MGKKGIYYGNTQDSIAFILGHGAEVYGGFSGSEQSLDERVLINSNTSFLDGQNERKVIQYKRDHVITHAKIDGFTIQNGRSETGNGGGALLEANVEITNCTIRNNVALNGGGICVHGKIIIRNSFLENNTASCGGGVYASLGIDTLLLGDCTIRSNVADSCGGGIYVTDGTILSINDNTFINNNQAAHSGGGVFSLGEVIINKGGVISGNQAHYEGGGLYLGSEHASSRSGGTMNGGVISNNEAMSGGGVMLKATSIILQDGEISNNKSMSDGGGIYCAGTLNMINGSTIRIQSNSAENNGGGIYMAAGRVFINGGVIGVESDDTPVSKIDAISKGGNYASNGAGLYIAVNSLGINSDNADHAIIGGNYATNGGGGIYSGMGNCVFNQGITICANSANIGGGICLSRAGGGFNSILNGCIVKYNEARSYGGGIYNDMVYGRSLIINNADISSNKAIRGGGIYNIGTFSMSNGLITANTASDGGGIYNVGSKNYTFSMTGGEISKNVADYGPGIYNYSGGNYSLSHSVKVSDIIYVYNSVDIFKDNPNTYFNIAGLTYHTDDTKPITVQLLNPSGYFNSFAKYSSAEEAASAVNNGIYVVANYGWRPVAVGLEVKVEKYTPPVVAANVIHVTPEGAGKKDGSSWLNATPDLYGEMIKDRTDTVQIWVKQGVYYGDVTIGQGGDKAAFILGKRNKIYGGFVGNESFLSDRPKQDLSVLDGQLMRRVICQLSDFADADSSFMDGFIIKNGVDTLIGTSNILIGDWDYPYQSGTDMTGNGGGVYLRRNGILRNCKIENCKAKNGGGAFNYGGKIINCSFINNEAEHAAGLFNRGIVLLGNGVISDNTATHSLGYGGGIFNMGTLDILDSGQVINNKGKLGSGVYSDANATMTMNGGEISENTGSMLGGGIYNRGTFFMNSGMITNNQASYGGGICNYGTTTLNSGSISYNVANTGGGVAVMNGGQLRITSSSVKIQSNSTTLWGQGGGIYVYDGDCYISGGTIGAYTEQCPESEEEALAIGGNVSSRGGGIYIQPAGVYVPRGSLSFENGESVIIGGNYSFRSEGGGICNFSKSITIPSNVTIIGNVSKGIAGGVYSNGKMILDGCRILNNKSYEQGGGAFFINESFIHAGTEIKGNKAVDGGGIYVTSSLHVSGGDFSDNEAIDRGGAIFSTNPLSIYDGKIFNNKAELGSGVFSGSGFSLSGSVQIEDIMYLPAFHSSNKISIGELTYHTDSTKPVTIQSEAGKLVAESDFARQYVDQKILVSTPGLKPVVLNNTHIYLYADEIRSMEVSSTTINNNEDILIYPTMLSASKILTISSHEEGTAWIWSVLGVLVGKYQLESEKTQILISYPKGNYVIKIKTNSGKEKTAKFIVK